MPKRKDIKTILVIGAGPIVIGQGCEFDYSGTQAIKALKEEGYRVVLINSNPATIMTDPQFSDKTYIEPISPEYVEAIIKKENPDAILPTVGGQTALNVAMKLDEEGILKKYNVELIGANRKAIETAESREMFKQAMIEIGLDLPFGHTVNSLEEANKLLENITLPAIIRPSFTLGGSGGSVAYNEKEFEKSVNKGLKESPTDQVLVEEYLNGWKEYELELIRDLNDNVIIICSIENIDPMGIHTGDSITIAPAMTLSDKEFQIMRNAAIKCIRKIGVDTGGSNVQFAVNPKDGRMVIIEMNPRVSRSSALASKATGFPIAKIAAKLAVGYSLDELKNDITNRTLAAFEPTIDYIVTKLPRFDFEKFSSASGKLGVQMQSVGEAMAIGRTFRESFQKAFRSLELNLPGFETKDPRAEDDDIRRFRELDIKSLNDGSAFRMLKVKEAIKQEYSIEEIHKNTGIDPWFLREIAEIVKIEKNFSSIENLELLKKNGFSDMQIANLNNISEKEVKEIRMKRNIKPVYKVVDTCAGEFEAETPYSYSTYESQNDLEPLKGKKIIILGGGPNRIGQGIEFDYCCVQAVFGLRKAGFKSIMVNCNPETVSTDFDLADRLYFEPITFEDIMNIIDFEKPDGVFVQFGGQTPLKIADQLHEAGVKIFGTSSHSINLAENREEFAKIIKKLNILTPQYCIAKNYDDIYSYAETANFPVLVRPSFVLGGRAMQIVYSKEQLVDYVFRSAEATSDHPILIDQFIESAFEFDVDALSDGENIFVAGIMQHIEEAGVHSGDSSCVLPPYEMSESVKRDIVEVTRKLSLELKVVGLINLQFAVKDNKVYVLEVNPRSSRTVPFVSKYSNIPLANIAAQISTGKKIKDFDLFKNDFDHFAVKKAVLPFKKFKNEKVFLGPEMKSTGEVMGIDNDSGKAFLKAMKSDGYNVPKSGTAFLSVNDTDKTKLVPIAQKLTQLGFSLLATKGTNNFLNKNKIKCEEIFKVGEGRPNVVDEILNDNIHLVVNTPEGPQSRFDEEAIGKTSVMKNVLTITTLSGARATIDSMRHLNEISVKALQEYFE
ncbi:MAG: carbamoyl-phosphate synthase large subunit [Flammeovirgaceae bacterium TMED290]|mgnify:CR=1 FL=1|nr:MAG: carbamoyl-phosphate synthase large subunit [Flammeovirgaceae bacterium TMED290]|tara:strand:+ start:4037 stop:7231 length:3195 start_codon:yes stop_codon:yes gene_type:complete